MACSTLRMLLQRAYQPLSTTPTAPIQIIGGPNWIDSDRWDIQAKFNCGGSALSSEQIQQMLRSMLEDRFKLKAHKETREGQVYSLVVVRDRRRSSSPTTRLRYLNRWRLRYEPA